MKKLIYSGAGLLLIAAAFLAFNLLAGLGLGVGLKYVSERQGQASNSTFDMDGYGLVDLLAYYPLTENVRLNLNLNNVFDKHYEERLELSGRTAHPACGDFAQPVKTGAR